MKIFELTAIQIKEKICSGELTAFNVVDDLFNYIAIKDKKIGSYLELNRENAVLKAKEIDLKVKDGKPLGVLAGIPIAVKDNICTTGMKTTCGSRILSNYYSPYNAHVIDSIHNEDGILIGKTNLDEFAMGSTNEYSSFQKTVNPWNHNCVPGGSSGGSAAAVAADLAFIALGSDTGGSVRQPASFCGTVGLKPTYGRVSRFGLVAFASSLDQVGTFSKDIKDSALLLQVISGKDTRDTTCSDAEVPDFVNNLDSIDTNFKIGVPKEYFGEGLHDEVRKSVNYALEIYKNLGAEIVEISLPHTEFAVSAYYIVATAEASSNLSRYDGVRYGYRSQESEGIIQMYESSRSDGFGNEVKRRILMGNHVLSAGSYDAYYLKATKVRTLIKNDFDKAFKTVDCIVCPTAPVPAYTFGECVSNPLEMYLSDIYTLSASLAGVPGVSIPCGFASNGLPIGLQILGKHFDELKVLQIARLFEKNTTFHMMKPNI